MHIHRPSGAGVRSAPNPNEIVAPLGAKRGGGDSHRHFRSHCASLVIAIASAAIGDAHAVGRDRAIRWARNNRPARRWRRWRKWRRCRQNSRAAVGAVGAEAAPRKLGSGSAIVANTVGGEGARLRAGLCPCEAHHLGEEEDASESRAKGPPNVDRALLQGTNLFALISLNLQKSPVYISSYNINFASV